VVAVLAHAIKNPARALLTLRPSTIVNVSGTVRDTRALQLKAVGGKPEEVDANLLKAVGIAEKVGPYRHHKLAAIKLNKDPLPPGLRQDASLEELEAEMKKHWKRWAPVLDLEALMAPADGSATRDVPQDGAGDAAE
jgi:hypothetical protein